MSEKTKRLEESYIAHVSRELERLVREQYDNNQTNAAKALGLSQPHLSNLISGKSGRGPGLHTLLLMRAKTGRSIDELLGLPPVGDKELSERLRMTVETEIARIRREARLEAEALRAELRGSPAPRLLPASAASKKK